MKPTIEKLINDSIYTEWEEQNLKIVNNNLLCFPTSGYKLKQVFLSKNTTSQMSIKMIEENETDIEENHIAAVIQKNQKKTTFDFENAIREIENAGIKNKEILKTLKRWESDFKNNENKTKILKSLQKIVEKKNPMQIDLTKFIETQKKGVLILNFVYKNLNCFSPLILFNNKSFKFAIKEENQKKVYTLVVGAAIGLIITIIIIIKQY
ncbi:hypothetical protein NUSPORA_01272 [Nucleospora cyclopteri]